MLGSVSFVFETSIIVESVFETAKTRLVGWEDAVGWLRIEQMPLKEHNVLCGAWIETSSQIRLPDQPRRRKSKLRLTGLLVIAPGVVLSETQLRSKTNLDFYALNKNDITTVDVKILQDVFPKKITSNVMRNDSFVQ